MGAPSALGGPRPEPSLQARSPAAPAVLARFAVAQCSVIEPFGAVLVCHFSRDRWLFAVGGQARLQVPARAPGSGGVK